MFALVVGVNTYPRSTLTSLSGAEADARQWGNFLQEFGGNSENRIELLLGAAATRNAIVQAFKELANGDFILEGDPIIIFYAGHGDQVLRQRKDGVTSSQRIFPYDYCDNKDDTVQAISDHEISVLIDEIAMKKGNNIVGRFQNASRNFSHRRPLPAIL